jgi:hypothetical protein
MGPIGTALPVSALFTKAMTVRGDRWYLGAIVPMSTGNRLLDDIEADANARDVPYRSLIKVWLQEKLQSS